MKKPTLLLNKSVFALLFFLITSFFVTAQTYTSSTTATVPAGTTSITIEAWGGGGGGSSRAGAAGGGGGGGYTRGLITGLSGGETITITVGGGGTAGSAGGTTTVTIGSNTITANGGSSTATVTGGAGGAAVTVTGIVKASWSGGAGGSGRVNTGGGNNEGGGGGGGSATATAAGAAGSIGEATGGAGGGSTGGAGADGDGSPDAAVGIAPGGGGGGRGEGSSTSKAGAGGQVILSYVDVDGDGVTNSTDLDDDNDGILDTVECAGSTTEITLTTAGVTQLAGSGSTAAVAVNDVYLYSNKITYLSVNYDIVVTITGESSTTGVWQFNGTNFNGLGIIANEKPYITFSISIVVAGSATVGTPAGTPVTINNVIIAGKDLDGLGGANTNEVFGYGINANAGTYTHSTLVAGSNLTADGDVAGNPTDFFEYSATSAIPVAVADTDFSYAVFLNYNQFQTQNFTLGYTGTDITAQNRQQHFRITTTNPCDTDRDGIADQFDLDSDNDNCTDVLEAGFTDGDANGTLGSTPDTVDANGQITGDGGYTGTHANVTTYGPKAAITAQPANQFVISGSNASFSVTVTGATITYQWQSSTDGGFTWNNLTNAGIYSGVTTATLTVTGVTITQNNYKYRVLVDDTSYTCGEVTSNFANLALLVDTDSDGVGNTTDLDDDNDGILDTVECAGSTTVLTLGSPTSQLAGTGTSAAVAIGDIYLYRNKITYLGVQYDIVLNITGVVTSIGGSWSINGATNFASSNNRAVDNPYLTYTITVVKTGSADASPFVGTPVTIKNVTISAFDLDGLTYLNDVFGYGTGTYTPTTVTMGSNLHMATEIAAVSSFNQYSATNASPGGQLDTDPTYATILQYEQFQSQNFMFGFSGFNTAVQAVRTQYISLVSTNPCDTDRDGIADQFDLDSDNDNCTDVLEAGFTDGDANGTLGSTPDTVDANGQITGDGGYSGTHANVTTYGPKAAITAQPANQFVISGSNASFSVTVTGATITYQWQSSTDGGFTWNTLTNAGIYSGVTTATMTVTGVTNTQNNYKYRVLVDDTSYTCGEVTSNFANLAILVDTDNDGVEDTTDLDDDNDGILDTVECTSSTTQIKFDTSASRPKLVGTGNEGNLTPGDVYLFSNSITHLGVVYDMILTITGEYSPSGRWQLDIINFAGIDIVATENPYLTYTVTVVQAGSANAGNPSGTPVTINNVTISAFDLDGTGSGSFNDIFGYGSGTYLPGAVTMGANIESAGHVSGGPSGFSQFSAKPPLVSTPNALDTDASYAVSVHYSQFQSQSFMLGFTGDTNTPQEARGQRFFLSSTNSCDTDGDLLADQVDLDSDADGCFDTNEAYSSNTTDTNGDGTYGGAIGSGDVNTSGQVTGAAYPAPDTTTTPVGSTFKIATTATLSSISNQTVNSGSSTTFNATGTATSTTAFTSGTPNYSSSTDVSSTLVYQWQISTNGGSTYSDITNSGVYSNATTNTLSISNVSCLNSNRYRLRITHPDNVCLSVTSEATLTVNPISISSKTTTICSGSTFTVTPVNGADLVPSGTTYSWSAPSVTGITGTASGSGASNISGTLTNSNGSDTDVVYTVTPSSSGCTGPTFTVTVTVPGGTAGWWTGLISTDWFDCRNWQNGLPSYTVDANILPISANSNRLPVIDTSSPFASLYSNVATAKDIIIQSGGSITMASAELLVSGNWRNSGSFTPGTGMVTFNGGTANQVQTINAGIKTNETFYNLKTNVTNTAKGISVLDAFELTVQNDLLLASGDIRLTGEAQLVQNGIAANTNTGTGQILIDQQGKQNSFNYNYWSSPVSPNGTTYTIGSVLRDGTDVTTNPFSPGTISFGDGEYFADGTLSNPIKISTSWLWMYNSPTPDSNTSLQDYYLWKYAGDTETLKIGEGFTMKGTGGTAAINSLQNYVFVGKPNSGTISLNLPLNNTYLVGNPYPSALDADEFIKDNLKSGDCTGCRASDNVFNGALYFWDHFGVSNSHILSEYEGGYATYTLMGGVVAVSNIDLTASTGASGLILPKRYIPVGQSFFVDSAVDSGLSGTVASIDGGILTFKNSQRIFVRESSGTSSFLKTSGAKKQSSSVVTDNRLKIRLAFYSATGIKRQLLLGKDSNASNNYDIGFDGQIYDLGANDMFWKLDEARLVIQAVPDFNKNRTVPIGIVVSTEGVNKIQIDEIENMPIDQEIYLYDDLTKEYHDIKSTSFSVTLAPGEYTNRFSLKFENDKTESTLSTEETEFNNSIIVYYTQNNETLNIQNKSNDTKITSVGLYNLVGQHIANYDIKNQINQNEIKIKLANLSSATYIVKLKTSEGEINKKIIIK